MKKYFISIILIFTFNINILNAQFSFQSVFFTGNNIKNYFLNSGIFNSSGFQSGLIWHYQTDEYYVYTSGLSATCLIDNHIAMFACSYRGELYPGYVKNYNGVKNNDFKIYFVKSSDNSTNNPDYANWYKMVPYGAPYIDVNSNSMFDAGIDRPGIPEAKQTIFICFTDAFQQCKTANEGFGGGVMLPLLNAEIHFTAWGYNDPILPDVQFLKYDIINKGDKNWDKFYVSMFCDPDIKFGFNDYPGCDTIRNLGYVYNADSTSTSGAYGMRVLKGLKNKITGEVYDFSSFIWILKNIECESEPYDANEAYNYMKGLKTDGSSYYNPLLSLPTKFIFSGDPETGRGWVPSKGYVAGCNGHDTLLILQPYDAKFVLGLGANNLSIAPCDTQRLYFAQMLAMGNSNKNSVTQLKSLSDRVKIIFDAAIYNQVNNFNGVVNNFSKPGDFFLSQNFSNPFNAITKISYGIPRVSNVKLEIFDVSGKRIALLIDGEVQEGYYEIDWNASGFASGIYFYRMEVVDKTVNLQKKYSNIKKLVLVK